MKKWYYLNKLIDEPDRWCQSLARTQDWDEAERWLKVLRKTYNLGELETWIADEPRGYPVNWGSWKHGTLFT